jgi:hypothetical protein
MFCCAVLAVGMQLASVDEGIQRSSLVAKIGRKGN